VDHIDLDIAEGKLFSLLGPSGCGKTTTLRMIAGLEAPDDGQIVVDGEVLSDSKRVVLPEKRNMGMVFQSYAVWPHMSVWDNVAYGLKLKRVSRSEIEGKVREMLGMVGLYEYRDRFPTQLSGGQQQRVALARALAGEPRILLLDEPLCNLDAKLRENMRFEIRSLQQRLGITAVYVTHSQDEALAVSDEIIIMRGGKILQRGAPEEIYARPNGSFVADFIGLINIFQASVAVVESDRYTVRLENGLPVVAAKAKGQSFREGDAVKLMIRPENLLLETWNPSKFYNAMDAAVEHVSFAGCIVNYFLRADGMEHNFRCQATPPVRLAEGGRARLMFAPEDCILTLE
jgi:iron(III) transport system ATP-binding protein